MKRHFTAVFLIFILALSLASCAGPVSDDTTIQSGCKADSWEERPKTDAILAGKLIRFYDGSFILAGADSSELYRFSPEVKVYDLENRAVGAEYLKAGQNVEIGYSGLILESYPAQLGTPVYVKVNSQGDDMVGFYQTVLNDLWSVDPGLNPDTGVLAFDLAAVENLNEAEKAALMFSMSREHNLADTSGTFDELSEQGYINQEKLYFENGMLFTFELSDVKEDSFTFNVRKWRSGTGAFFFHDCKAVKTDGVWSYTVGVEMIS